MLKKAIGLANWPEANTMDPNSSTRAAMLLSGLAFATVVGCDYRWTSADRVQVREMLESRVFGSERRKPTQGQGNWQGDPSKSQLRFGDQSAQTIEQTLNQKTPNEKLPDQAPVQKGGWVDRSELPILQFEIIYLGNRPVGYTRRSIELATAYQLESLDLATSEASQAYLCIEAESRIRISRKTAGAIDQAVVLRTIEKPDGQLVGISGSIDTGATKRQFDGVVKDGSLRIEQTEDRIVSTNTVPWEPQYRGPFAIEQSLRAEPMQLKQVRTVRYLDPFQMSITESRLEAISVGETIDFAGLFSQRVEIENRSITQGRSANSLMWIDSKGVVRKTYTPGIDRQTFDCDPITARHVISKEEFDATVFKDMPLFGSFPKVPESGGAVFRVQSGLLQENGSVSSKSNQRVQRIDDKTWEIEVFQDLEQVDTKNDPVTESALASSGLIDWREPVLQRWISTQRAENSDSLGETQAQLQVGPEDSQQSQRRASAARNWVAKMVARTSLDRNLQTPATTIRERKGDSIDQSILLATALRSMKIPSRLAIGFRAEASTVRPTCQIHLWVEYHDTKRWIPIDSFIDTDSVPLDRIKITETTLPSINAFEPILGVIRLLPDIEITARTKKP